MAQITGILCRVDTGDVGGAGTNGNVYLGLGGREFGIDSYFDDFERGDSRFYRFGSAFGPDWRVYPNVPVIDVEQNDPRVGFRLNAADLHNFPTYIRFEPMGSNANWNLSHVFVMVYDWADEEQPYATVLHIFGTPVGFDNLWLGNDYGKILYLIDLNYHAADSALIRLSAIRDVFHRAGLKPPAELELSGKQSGPEQIVVDNNTTR